MLDSWFSSAAFYGAYLLRIAPAVLAAGLVTAELAMAAIALGLLLAFAIAALRFSPIPLLRGMAAVFVSVVRGTPVLIQMFLLYFGGPQVGIQLEPFTAGVLALGINIAAYMSEAIRGAVVAVDKGQFEAARALGFSAHQTMVNFILPQAARLMVRPLGVNAVALLKSTALVSSISVVELTFTAQRFGNASGNLFAVYGLAGLLYFVMVAGLTHLVNGLDRHYRLA